MDKESGGSGQAPSSGRALKRGDRKGARKTAEESAASGSLAGAGSRGGTGPDRPARPSSSDRSRDGTRGREVPVRGQAAVPNAASDIGLPQTLPRPTPARLAVYDSAQVQPRVVELSAESHDDYVGLLSTKAYQASQEKGGRIPFTVIHEIVENLVHAEFLDVVVTVLDQGNTVRVADRGPGIPEKERALELGFTTAGPALRGVIRGVGCGLSLAREALASLQGTLLLEDNLGTGTVVTLSVPAGAAAGPPEDGEPARTEHPGVDFRLTHRQKRVLSLVTEVGVVGPSRVASELGISPSSAYRDLVCLEQRKLIESDAHGKRSLTAEGITYLDAILNSP